MILAIWNSDIPPEWNHDPSIQNQLGNTVAMLLARDSPNIRPEWIHDSKIVNGQK